MPFKKQLPMSRAMRQGGAGTVPPEKGGGSDPFDLGKIKGSPKTTPGGPTKIGKGVPPFPKFNKGGRARGR